MDHVHLIANAKSNITVKVVQTKDIKDFNKWWPRLLKKTTLSVKSFGRAAPEKINSSARASFNLKQPGARLQASANIFN
jgi:hypothetical protein